MAAVTPRKRSRSSVDTDDSSEAFKTPVKEMMPGFREGLSPLKKSRKICFASQIKWSPSSSEEKEENEAVQVKPVLSRRLDVSPLQAASVPTATQREALRNLSLKPAASYKPLVPAASFYSKEKHYLTPLERKQLNENSTLGDRNGDENLLAASRPGKIKRNKSSKPTKHGTSSRHGKTVPKTLKKGKGEIPVGKPSVDKENVSCLVKKKMDSPFRVLSMTVKPALKLQMGAAFFSAGKKSHSKKPFVDTMSLQCLPKSLGTNCLAPPTTTKPNAADGNKALEAGAVLKSVSTLQKKENEHREDLTSCLNQEGDSECGGKTSPQKSQSPLGLVCTSQPADTGDGAAESVDIDKTSSSTTCDSDDDVIPPSQSPHKLNKRASAPNAVVYPIFSAPPASKKKTQAVREEPTSPFGSSSLAKPSAASQKSKKAKELCKSSRDQMIIDAGQKHFGAIVCKSCGMIYTAASPEDEAQHIQHHERFLRALRYMGWKNERVVAEFWDGKIVLILPNDPKYAVKKAEDVREIVDNELGFKQVSLSCPAETKIYLFVSNEKMIVGCLVAESIKQAFRVLSEAGPGPCPREQDVLQPQRAWRCSPQPQPALCGISRIWVFGPRRGSGIARRMVDVLRNTFMYGSFLSTDEIAFSDPTPHGKLFATRYCQTPNFLVYNFIHSN
ncbi:N-acetyltransferase ESCO2 [Colius striatus]|uniref:N-acetyltransferase ESCO2 n=1 Tax=Colius striatus TaxID=57412 RepID=UPI002B1DB6A5|nr:N-acetyltransferase ESCO2 [Colius striatus]XP_061846411.1 N-acetyltransferase ESCO2 [Colius striatus]XP_061846412.1 N-acetyltransferase ESCO2 [Colius striatus]XP_061846413.1 N-acetyltransferase ESCO2 [Colius striatus]